MNETFILLALSAQPDFSAEAEDLHHTYYVVFACPTSHPDPEQLLNDILAQRHLSVLQKGEPVTVTIAGISEDLRSGLAQDGYGLSLNRMHF